MPSYPSAAAACCRSWHYYIFCFNVCIVMAQLLLGPNNYQMSTPRGFSWILIDLSGTHSVWQRWPDVLEEEEKNQVLDGEDTSGLSFVSLEGKEGCVDESESVWCELHSEPKGHVFFFYTLLADADVMYSVSNKRLVTFYFDMSRYLTALHFFCLVHTGRIFLSHHEVFRGVRFDSGNNDGCNSRCKKSMFILLRVLTKIWIRG